LHSYKNIVKIGFLADLLIRMVIIGRWHAPTSYHHSNSLVQSYWRFKLNDKIYSLWNHSGWKDSCQNFNFLRFVLKLNNNFLAELTRQDWSQSLSFSFCTCRLDVNSFEGDKPFAVPKKQISHSFNLSLPYCLNNRCLPELHLSYQWYSINDKNFSAPLTNYTIGSFDVVLRLSINNSRDIAQQPPYEFRWLKRHNIHLADDKINNVWSRRECNQTESEAETKYFCVLQKKVTSTVPVSMHTFWSIDIAR